MKVIKFIMVLLLIAGLSSTATAQSKINSRSSSMSFTVKNLGLEVEGKIRGLSGEITFDESNVAASKISAKVLAKGIRTDNKMRDEHLQEEEFFHVSKHPYITFESSKIEKSANGYVATGSLTMKGTSKEVSIPFTYSSNTFSGELTVNRNDYDIGGNGFLNTIGDDVTIKIKCVVD